MQDELGERTAAQLRADGGEATYLHLNVVDDGQWSTAIATVAELVGALHILVNNAGVAARTSRIVTLDRAAWDKVLEINLTGPMLGMQASAELIRDSGGGAIINIGSAAALTGHFATPYTASKWRLRGLTKAAALEFAPWGIRVLAVHPGIVQTPIVDGSDDFIDAMIEHTPARRIGTPDEIAHLVAFLASDEASFVNGVDVPVDGGFTEFGLYHSVAHAVETRSQRW